MRIILLALATFLLSTLSAEAETCYTTAEQTLYTMVENIQAGTQKEVQPALDLATWAIETCSDRTDAQALAAMLMSSVIQTANTIETYDTYVSLLNRAITQNDKAWKTNGPVTKITKLDGAETDFYGFNYASSVFTDAFLPTLVGLWQQGHTHALVSGQPLEQCPFARSDSSRVENELIFWKKVANIRDIPNRFDLITQRLSSLQSTCPDHKLELSFAAAEYHGDEILRLTSWVRIEGGVGMFGSDLSDYTVPALPGQFSVTEMENKKAELDAKARTHVAPLNKYITDYESAYKAVDTSNMGPRARAAHTSDARWRNNDIADWKKAAAKLESE